MAAIGLDFGSSNSSLSWRNPVNGKVEAVLFKGDGTVKIPSGMIARGTKIYTGFDAESFVQDVYGLSDEQKFDLLSSYIPSLKRILDPKASELIGDSMFTHRQLLAYLFQDMVTMASEHCGTDYKIDSVVYTYPVDFSQEKVELIGNALTDVGLNVEAKLPEPEAAAYGYGATHLVKDGEGLLIFDFGGGTVDVAYVIKKGKNFKLAVPPRGNSQCGGRDIDNVIYEYFRKVIRKEKGVDITSDNIVDPGVMLACRRLKEMFSGKGNECKTGVLVIDNNRVERFELALTRQRFNELISPVVADALHVAKEVLNSVEKHRYPLNGVVMIGGSSNLTLLKKQLEEMAQVPIICGGEKDIAVAMGALVSLTKEQMVAVDEKKDVEKKVQPEKRKDDKQNVVGESKEEAKTDVCGVKVVPPDENDGILDFFS